MSGKFARLLNGFLGLAAVAVAVAGCGGGDPAMPASGAPAALRADAPPGPVPASVAPLRAEFSAATPGSAIEDFEHGMADWTNWGNAQVVAGVGMAGSSAMQIGPAAGGAALNVPGAVPGTAYRLTVQLKLDDPSQLPQSAYGGTGPFVGVDMLDSAGNKVLIEERIYHQRGAKTAEGWVQVTMDFVAPQNAATAVIWVWKNSGAYGYVDDVVFGPASPASPPPPAPPPTSGNMVGNGGFESGMTGWSDWGNARLLAGAGTSGSNAVQVGSGAGGAAYRVNGLVAGTTYRLTATLKVSNPSETVWAGFNFLSSSGSFQGGTRTGPVTSTGYVTVTVEWVASATTPSADVYVWKNDGSGYGYMDDVVFAPVDPAPPPASDNLLTNGGFESGMRDWVNWGNAVEASGEGSSGSWALRVGTAAGGAGHDVSGIAGGTTYRLTAQARVNAGSETVYVGVNILDHLGAVVARNFVPVTTTAYSTATLTIVAPADAVKAVVYVWKDAGSGFAYVDDFVFEAAGGSPPAPPPPPSANLVANGGFENGLASWSDWGNATTSTDAAAGSSAARVGTGGGGFGQDVAGIVAGTTYRLGGIAKVSSAGETGYLGVRFTDDAGSRLAEQSVAFSSSAYSTVQLDLVAPANATSALVYVWKNAGSGFAYVDEVALSQVTSGGP